MSGLFATTPARWMAGVLRLPAQLCPGQIPAVNVSRKVIEMEKKRWQKPELIVLERSRPEEAVLLACKASGRSSGNSAYNSQCYFHVSVTGSTCGTCNSVAAS